MIEANKDYDIAWLLKDVRKVTVRNLTCKDEISLSLPNPKIEIFTLPDNGNSEVSTSLSSSFRSESLPKGCELLFTGKSLSETCNPTWTLSGMISSSPLFHDRILDSSSLIIQFMDDNIESQSLLTEFIIDMNKLVRFGTIQLSTVTKLPLNSIFFETDNGYFVTQELYKQLINQNILPVPSRYSEDIDYENIKNGKEIKNRIHLARNSMKILDEKISEEINHFEIARIKINHESMLEKINKLRMEVEIAEAEAIEEELKESLERDLFNQTDGMKSCMELCESQCETIKKLNITCIENRDDLLKIQFYYEARQLKLLNDLQSIYPIEAVQHSDEYTIRSIELPRDYSLQNDDHTSSALGYLVHLILLISKYLEIPLRYHLLFFASRSMIRDPIQTNGLALPLYRKGVEKERFENAMKWLQRNIEQLINSRGLTYDSKKSMLFNTNQLFECLSCPKIVA